MFNGLTARSLRVCHCDDRLAFIVSAPISVSLAFSQEYTTASHLNHLQLHPINGVPLLVFVEGLRQWRVTLDSCARFPVLAVAAHQLGNCCNGVAV